MPKQTQKNDGSGREAREEHTDSAGLQVRLKKFTCTPKPEPPKRLLSTCSMCQALDTQLRSHPAPSSCDQRAGMPRGCHEGPGYKQ